MPAKQEMKTLYHCVFNLNLHLVLVTKYRRRCIGAAILARLQAIFATLAERWGCELLEFNAPDPQGVRKAGAPHLSQARILEPLVLHR